MGNPNLLPYETIVRATSGEPEAVDENIRHIAYHMIIDIPLSKYLENTVFNQSDSALLLQSTGVLPLSIRKPLALEKCLHSKKP